MAWAGGDKLVVGRNLTINGTVGTIWPPDGFRSWSIAIDLEQEEREQDEEAVKKSSLINRIRMENWSHGFPPWPLEAVSAAASTDQPSVERADTDTAESGKAKTFPVASSDEHSRQVSPGARSNVDTGAEAQAAGDNQDSIAPDSRRSARKRAAPMWFTVASESESSNETPTPTSARFKTHANHCAKISKVINRLPGDVTDRDRNYRAEICVKEGRWSEGEEPSRKFQFEVRQRERYGSDSIQTCTRVPTCILRSMIGGLRISFG
ncbi:MAG: hypothetical protein M1816_001643 [Peltula sp. TS41687]|nr:MAG: hypothetical protein M1816_001643 [Peltula sp. TS41687]